MAMKLFEWVRDFISRRRNAYCKTFMCPPGQEVLEDLARFCRANDSCFHTNQRANDVLIGRHEVWLRIQKHLRLTDEQLWALNAQAKQPISHGENDD